MPGSFTHLTRRFFEYLIAKPLNPERALQVRTWLTEAQQDLFFAQNPKDQAHGYNAGLVVISAGITDPEVTQAALLHDVGKRHSNLGVLGRSLVSIMIKLRLPLTTRMKTYRDHGRLGSEELLQAGSPTIVVEFARHHHRHRPTSIERAIWDILQRADAAKS